MPRFYSSSNGTNEKIIRHSDPDHSEFVTGQYYCFYDNDKISWFRFILVSDNSNEEKFDTIQMKSNLSIKVEFIFVILGSIRLSHSKFFSLLKCV
jgi:hypothetical protein